MRKFSSLSLLLLAITFLASCTKEGPEGPVGATGAQGPPGTPGATGAPGQNGAGITTYSAWFQTGTGWATTPDYAAEFIYTKAAPSVTQSIIDQGVILAFMKGDPLYDGTPQLNTVHPLAYTVGTGFGFTDVYDFAVEEPGEIIFFYKSDFAWTAADLASVWFRYVTIPGTVAGRGVEPTYDGLTKAELKSMSYEQLAARFNIPDEGSNIR